MKNAYVLEHHHGDDGTLSEGMILRDISNQRFEALAKAGLIREASADEVKAGYKPPFTPEGDERQGAGVEIDLNAPGNEAARKVADEAQRYINQLRNDHDRALDAERDRADAAEKAQAAAEQELEAVRKAANEDREAAQAEIADLKTKLAQAPANKQAPKAQNKAS